MTIHDLVPETPETPQTPGTPTASAPAVPFPEAPRRTKGYDKRAVDHFLELARLSFESRGTDPEALSSRDVRGVAFPLSRHGYAIAPVDAALARIEDAFAAQERGRAVSTGGVRSWVGQTREAGQEILDRLTRAPRHRFERVGSMRYGYRVDEVDLVTDKISRYLETGESVSVDQVRAVAFRMQRGGYREVQVDALLDAVVEVMLAVR
ncbi:DivIVA domain-containing protein [Microbacterium sp. CJ88]|uniref:DivIVA domain-containing protein n=1 Tax=Microbacterium sp. CJ88 TaxID=3445672 RepID=UPI003F65EEFD